MIGAQMLTKFISISSYSPEVSAFVTLITSTKVFSRIICKSLKIKNGGRQVIEKTFTSK